MEYKMVTIPFDLETAKKINIGERVGQIVTEKGRNRAEIVYEDNSSICPLLVVIHSISVSADWFYATGKAFSSENRLLLEVPEYTTFKDGDVLSNEEGNFIFILNANGVRKEGNKKWNISLFAREIVDDYNGLPYKYECSNGTLWDYCIHFEGNECLLGTTENPEKMKMVKLSDFYPYDRNKGGIQELHHKIESKTLQYWGEDSGILIGITPIYKRRLWSEEVKVVNDKMTNMKTRTYEGVQHGDWVRCVLCGAQMLLPCGADKCPECSSEGTLTWVDEDKQEMDAKHLDCLVPIRKLELQEYLSPEILKMEHI